MPLTGDFSETVQIRARRDPEFRRHLLIGGVECLFADEVEVGKIVLRDYIIATVGFEQLGAMTGESPEDLTQMFGPDGAPLADDLSEVIALLAEHEGVQLDMSAAREERPTEVGASPEASATI